MIIIISIIVLLILLKVIYEWNKKELEREEVELEVRNNMCMKGQIVLDESDTKNSQSYEITLGYKDMEKKVLANYETFDKGRKDKKLPGYYVVYKDIFGRTIEDIELKDK